MERFKFSSNSKQYINIFHSHRALVQYSQKDKKHTAQVMHRRKWVRKTARDNYVTHNELEEYNHVTHSELEEFKNELKNEIERVRSENRLSL